MKRLLASAAIVLAANAASGHTQYPATGDFVIFLFERDFLLKNEFDKAATFEIILLDHDDPTNGYVDNNGWRTDLDYNRVTLGPGESVIYRVEWRPMAGDRRHYVCSKLVSYEDGSEPSMFTQVCNKTFVAGPGGG